MRDRGTRSGATAPSAHRSSSTVAQIRWLRWAESGASPLCLWPLIGTTVPRACSKYRTMPSHCVGISAHAPAQGLTCCSVCAIFVHAYTGPPSLDAHGLTCCNFYDTARIAPRRRRSAWLSVRGKKQKNDQIFPAPPKRTYMTVDGNRTLHRNEPILAHGLICCHRREEGNGRGGRE